MLLINLIYSIKAALIGLFAFGLYVLNSIFWFIIVLPISILYLIPISGLRFRIRKFFETIPSYWIACNTLIQQLTISKTRFILKHKKDFSLSDLSPDAWYLLISNHQSWVDILVLERLFNKRIPLLKFFLKNTLFWVLPLLGWFCWILGFPFIHRYSQKQLAKNPLLRMRNLSNIQIACEASKAIPTTLTTFVEGRRFTPKLQKAQASPYKHLLRPRAGGFALSVSALHQKLDKILNVTIVYSHPKASLWDFLCGRIACITIYSEAIPVTPSLVGDYLQDPIFQLHIQNWLNEIWAKKDLLIESEAPDYEWLSHEV